MVNPSAFNWGRAPGDFTVACRRNRAVLRFPARSEVAAVSARLRGVPGNAARRLADHQHALVPLRDIRECSCAPSPIACRWRSALREWRFDSDVCAYAKIEVPPCRRAFDDDIAVPVDKRCIERVNPLVTNAGHQAVKLAKLKDCQLLVVIAQCRGPIDHTRALLLGQHPAAMSRTDIPGRRAGPLRISTASKPVSGRRFGGTVYHASLSSLLTSSRTADADTAPSTNISRASNAQTSCPTLRGPRIMK